MSDSTDSDSSPDTRTKHNRARLPKWVDEDAEVDYCYAWCPTCEWGSDVFGLAGNAMDAAEKHGEYGSFPGCWDAKAFAVFTDESEVELA